MLTQTMTTLIEQNRLGFVASVDALGKPNLSPKGTFVIKDSNTLMFTQIRSPQTLKNIKINPEIEINFVDPFTRKGVRVRGIATIFKKNSEKFTTNFHRFQRWGELSELIQDIIRVDIILAKQLSSPIYDLGAKTDDLVKIWHKTYSQIHQF